MGMAIPYSRYLAGTLPWYSVLIISGIVAALALATREEKRLGLPRDTVIDLTLLVVPLGVVGARLYYVVFRWDLFAADPLSVLYVWQGGLAIYGGIIAGALTVYFFALRRKLSFPTLADMIMPGLALAQAIGRWGNYFNMEAYGPPITHAALQFFPIGVLIPAADGEMVWHMATFFYESMWNLLVFSVLWFLIRPRSRRPGTVTLWYFLLYGVGRFMIEGLRTDSLMLLGLRASQLLSALLALFSAAMLLRRHFRSPITKEAN